MKTAPLLIGLTLMTSLSAFAAPSDVEVKTDAVQTLYFREAEAGPYPLTYGAKNYPTQGTYLSGVILAGPDRNGAWGLSLLKDTTIYLRNDGKAFLIVAAIRPGWITDYAAWATYSVELGTYTPPGPPARVEDYSVMGRIALDPALQATEQFQTYTAWIEGPRPLLPAQADSLPASMRAHSARVTDYLIRFMTAKGPLILKSQGEGVTWMGQ